MQTEISVLDPFGDKDFQAHPRQVKKWLKSLLQVDNSALREQLLDGINRLNRQPCSARHRIEIMELLQPLACTVIQEQLQYLISQSLPLSADASTMYAQAKSIISGMSIGYKIVVQQSAVGESRLDHKKTLKCIHHAMYFLSEDYVISSLVYESASEFLWKDMLQLYKYAERQELLNTPVKDISLQENSKHSIHQKFMHICLLAMVEPYTLRHSEVSRVSAYFEQISEQIEVLRDPAKTIINNNVYSIDLSANRPPRLSRVDDSSVSPDHRFLGIAALLDHLSIQIDQCIDDSRELVTQRGQLNIDLLKRIQQKLTANPTRLQDRIAAETRVYALTGLNRISKDLRDEVIAADGNNTNEIRIEELGLTLMTKHIVSTAKEEEIDPFAIKDCYKTSYPDELELVKFEGIQTIITDTLSPIKESDLDRMVPPDIEPEEPGNRWDVVDISAGGYRLSWKNSQRCTAQVGELIALQHIHNKAGNWRIGVIRWMQCHGARGLEAGVQLLSKHVISSGVCHIHSSSPDMINALILPGVEQSGSCSTLLLPKGSHKAGNKYLLQVNDCESEIILTKCLEIAGTYSSFEFDVLNYRLTVKS